MSKIIKSSKKIKATVKLQLQGGAANPAPPVGSMLGQHQVNLMDFCKKFNAATMSRKGETVPVIVSAPLTTSKDVTKKSEGKFSRAQTKNEISDQEIQTRLEAFIRMYLDGQGSMRINKIFKHDSAYLIGTTSSYCENLGRSHNSNHVWFVANETCVYQRCFCNCETLQGRKNGFCKDFSGRKHLLPPTIANLLFPNKKADKIKAAIRPNVPIVRDTVSSSCRILLPSA